MNKIDLLGAELKSDFLVDLFETYDVQVIYEYDRCHEGMEDSYNAEISELGLQFVFNEKQKLETLFIQPVEVSTWNPFEGKEITEFTSKSEAREYAEASGIQIKEGKAEFMGEEKDWIKFEFETHSIHYEFVDSLLKMITLQANKA